MATVNTCKVFGCPADYAEQIGDTAMCDCIPMPSNKNFLSALQYIIISGLDQ